MSQFGIVPQLEPTTRSCVLLAPPLAPLLAPLLAPPLPLAPPLAPTIALLLPPLSTVRGACADYVFFFLGNDPVPSVATRFCVLTDTTAS